MDILYFDCLAGISGDMIIGALLDLGVDQEKLISELDKLDIAGYQLRISRAQKSGITGTDFKVELESARSPEPSHDHDHTHEPETVPNHETGDSNHKHQHKHKHSPEDHGEHSHGQGEQQHRNLHDIKHLINDSNLAEEIKNLSVNMFQLVAEAEAKVHNKDISEVHFHEVGAVDSIVDIVGAAICIRELGVDQIYASELHIGTGFVECAHGTIPVPAPATAEILTDVPVYSKGVESELVTPTGAAVIKTLADKFIPLPKMTIEKTGYGLGDKNLAITNLLRVFTGQTKSKQSLVMLETNIDDLNPEIYSYLYPQLFEAGALDVYITNIMMKKNRPAVKVSVLANKEDVENIEAALFTETTTLGIRKYEVEREILERELQQVETDWGPMTVKVAKKNGEVINYAPEYEDCQAVASEFELPLTEVYQQVKKCWMNKKLT